MGPSNDFGASCGLLFIASQHKHAIYRCIIQNEIETTPQSLRPHLKILDPLLWAVPKSTVFRTSFFILPAQLANFSRPFFTSCRAPMTTGVFLVFILDILQVLYFESFSVIVKEVCLSLSGGTCQ